MKMAVPIFDLQKMNPCDALLINGPSLRPFMASRSAQIESFRGTQKGESGDYPKLKAESRTEDFGTRKQWNLRECGGKKTSDRRT